MGGVEIAQAPITPAERVAAIAAYIRSFRLTGEAAQKPARKLTWSEARDLTLDYARQGTLAFHPDTNQIFTARRDAQGQVVITPPAEPRAGSGQSAGNAGRFTIAPATLAGVEFRLPPGYAGGHGRIDRIDPRFLVLLVRLCDHLAQSWGASRVLCGRVSMADAGTHPVATNSHWWGRAIDFYGVSGEVGWGPYTIQVERDWGRQPITMPVDWGPVDPRTHQHRFRQGREYPNWPDGFEATTYRLAFSDNPDTFFQQALRRTPQVMYAARVFEAVYNLLAREAYDTPDPDAAPTRIGRSSRFIIHPDHRSTALRRSHIHHFHFGIGPTEHAGHWPTP